MSLLKQFNSPEVMPELAPIVEDAESSIGWHVINPKGRSKISLAGPFKSKELAEKEIRRFSVPDDIKVVAMYGKEKDNGTGIHEFVPMDEPKSESLLLSVSEAKKSHDEKDLVFQKKRLKYLNRLESSVENDKSIVDLKKRIKELERKIPIDVEAKVVESAEDVDELADKELAAWKERFKKAKSTTVAEFRKEFPQYKYRRQDDVVSLKLGEGLIKELSVVNKPSSMQGDLKKSDATDAGKSDVVDKAKAGQDISFNLMRNTINADGNVSGSDVANYIERAEELNDEVDTVPFGLETDDGQIVKVYVNAEQADKFEEAMKQMLGLEDDIEEAINRLTTEYDIVDVVWPTSPDDESTEDDDANLEIDDTSNLQLDPEDEEDFSDENYDVVGAVSKDEKKAEKEEAKDEVEDEIEAAAAEDEDGDDESDEDDEGGDEGSKKKKKKSSDEDEDEEDPDAEDDEEELDDEGKPKKKKKKKKAQPAEPVDDEDDVKEAKEATADSPSIAAAIKKMTSKGLHIAAMDEAPDNTVYIEDSQGEEYVMRGDKTLTKEKHGKKLTSYKKREKVQENNMSTIGSKFLSRVIQEAAPDKDGVKDGFNIPLDSQARALAAKLKLPFAKRLIAFHVMAGVPGRYLNTEDAEGSIAEAADMLRKKISVRRAFTSLYDGLATAKGYAIPDEKADAVKESDDEKYFIVSNEGGKTPEKYSSKAFTSTKEAKEKLKSMKDAASEKGKDDLADELADCYVMSATEFAKKNKLDEANKQKRGSFIQKLFETVLTQGLGLPQSLVTTTGPSAVGTGLYRTAELIEQDGTLERALRLLATRLGIKQSDAGDPVTEAKKPKDDGKPITVQGRKGMKSTPWSKTFKSQEAMEAWMDKHGEDISVDRYSKVAEEDSRFSRLSSMSEAADVGNDDYAEAVMGIVAALGIPDDVIQRRKTQIVQALRAKKASLQNRAQILTMMKRLQDTIDKGTRKPGPNQTADQENE